MKESTHSTALGVSNCHQNAIFSVFIQCVLSNIFVILAKILNGILSQKYNYVLALCSSSPWELVLILQEHLGG